MYRSLCEVANKEISCTYIYIYYVRYVYKLQWLARTKIQSWKHQLHIQEAFWSWPWIHPSRQWRLACVRPHLPCIHFLINSENCEKWGVDFLAMESPSRLSPLVLDGAWPWGLGFILTTHSNLIMFYPYQKPLEMEGSQWKNDLDVAQQQLSNFNIGL